MSHFFKWLVVEEKVPYDPTIGLTVKRKKTQGFLPWTYEDVITYEKRWPLGTRERVMLDVYIFTGLRRRDAARVGPGHVHNNVITLATDKSQGQTVVSLPMLDALKRTLAAGPTGKLSFICKEDGLPYVKESRGNKFKEACIEAGILYKSAPDSARPPQPAPPRRARPRINLWRSLAGSTSRGPRFTRALQTASVSPNRR
jgi:hypothetical protein